VILKSQSYKFAGVIDATDSLYSSKQNKSGFCRKDTEVSKGITYPIFNQGLSNLGVDKGDSLLVHCSMSKFGQIYGGAQTVIESLIEKVGEGGTIVMPTLTSGRFDPSEWGNPPAPQEMWDEIRFTTPLFDSQKTPCDHTMSSVYELFRTWPGSARSNHPHSSFAAWGKDKDKLLSSHKLGERFGETSPLGRLYEVDAKVLFLGTDFATNTCFHLAEYRQEYPPRRGFKIVTETNGRKSLIEYSDVNTNSRIFSDIGAAFETYSAIRETNIGQAQCRIFSLRQAVDFATKHLNSIYENGLGSHSTP
jgi:aminoglycoside 3-N-acetyltransferase